MKVLILFWCLAGVGLLATSAYARAVRKDAIQHRQYTQLNLNNNNNNNNSNRNNNNNHFSFHPVEASAATLQSAVNASNTLDAAALEPPHTTKRAITLREKRPSRSNSKFLQWPEDANVAVQHTENNDELELVENTTESPKRKLTTAAPNNIGNNKNNKNIKGEGIADRNRLTAKLRKHKKQEVGNETPAEVEQQSGAEVSTPVVGDAGSAEGTPKKTPKRQRKQKQKGEHKQTKEERENLHKKKVEKVNTNITNMKSSNKTTNKVKATKKPRNKPKPQALKAQNKQKRPATTPPKTNRKANTGLNRNRNAFFKGRPKKAQPLRRPANRRNRRRNRFNAPFYKFSRRTPKNSRSFRRFANRRFGRRRNRFHGFRRRRNRWRN